MYDVYKEVGRDRLPVSLKGAQFLTGYENLREYLVKHRLSDGRDECEGGKKSNRNLFANVIKVLSLSSTGKVSRLATFEM